MLQKLDTNIWVAHSPLRVFGLEVGTRMTVVKLPDEDLFLHSTISLSEALQKELDAIGNVKAIVAPNCYHHFFVKRYTEVYPEAMLYGAPGLPEKRIDLQFHGVLNDQEENVWAGNLEQILTRGMPSMNEVVFFHTVSRTLILTDICVNFPPTDSCLLRIYRRYIQDYDEKFAMARLIRFMVRNRSAFKDSCQKILQWDFDRITVTHGLVLESGGREAFQKAIGWVMK